MSRPARIGLALVVAALVGAPLPAQAQLMAPTRRVAVGQQIGVGLKVVGKMPVAFPPEFLAARNNDTVDNVGMVLNPARRRAYQLFYISGGQKLAIRAFDLDTFAPIGSGVPGPGYWLSPPEVPFVRGPMPGELAHHALDDAGGRLFVAKADGRSIEKIYRFDLDKIDRGDPDALTVRTVTNQPEVYLKGMRYYLDPQGRPKLLAVATSTPLSKVLQYDAQTLADDWAYSIPRDACESGAGASGTPRYQTPVWRSVAEPVLYTVCSKGGLGNVVRIPLDPLTGAPVITEPPRAFFQNRLTEDAFADPATDRVSFATSAGTEGKVFLGFDGREQAFVGAAGFLPDKGNNQNYTFGLDESTGRLYGYAADYSKADVRAYQGGLFLLESRLTPLPQTLQYPSLAYTAQPRILVDPAQGSRPTRILLRRATGYAASPDELCYFYPDPRSSSITDERGGCPDEDFYLIIQDTVPLGRQPTPEDQDINTQGVAEATGLTGRTYTAAGSAYGTRARLIGGLRAVSRGPNGEDDLNIAIAPKRPDVASEGLLNRLEPACYATDRELTVARVEQATVSQYETAATARYLEADEATRRDNLAPGTRCKSSKLGLQDAQWRELDSRAGSPWFFSDATCSGQSAQAARPTTARQTDLDEDDNPETLRMQGLPQDHAAQTSCSQSTNTVAASAHGEPVHAGDLISVGESGTDVRIAPLEQGGIGVSAIGWAKAITVGGISIESATATATSAAAGQAGTAQGSFQRTICGIRLGDGPASPCYTTAQDTGCLKQLPPDPLRPHVPQNRQSDYRVQVGNRYEQVGAEQGLYCVDSFAWLAKTLNARLGGRAEIFLREPEQSLLAGSTGGYIAAVQKNEAQVTNDALFVRDFQREVPALEIVVYRDGNYYGVGRYIIQLAGVRAATTYGTYCLPPGTAVGLKCQGAALGPTTGGVLGPQTRDGGAVSLPTPVINPPAVDTPAPPAPAPQAGIGPALVRTARGLVVRALPEGLLTTGIWLTVGLPLYLGSRRLRLALSLGRGS